MKHFKNADLTRLYNVSDKAVRNWIQGAQNGKNLLELYEEKGKSFIADTLSNNFLIEELVERGKKFRNKRGHVRLEPSPKFYTLYNSQQISTIINNLDKYHEFPQQFRNFGEGARYWDAYLNKLHAAGRDNLLVSTIELLKLEKDYLNILLAPFKRVNLVDVGVGNGLAVRDLLQSLVDSKKLGRYIGIDTSVDLLNITERNVKQWFGGEVKMEKFVRDINFEQFGDVLMSNSLGEDARDCTNLVLLLGGTLANLRKPEQGLDTVRDSMGKNDLLITTAKLDTSKARRFFDFNISSDRTPLSRRNKLVLELISISDDLYEVEQLFDEVKKSRFMRVKLKVDISITFKLSDYTKTIDLYKGDRILILRANETTDREMVDLYDKSEFAQLRTTLSANREYILMIVKPLTKE